MGQILFLSDTHLTLWDGKPWPDEDHVGRLTSFLGQLARKTGAAEDIEKVVLLGDIFDTWRCRPDRLPPAYEEIMESHAAVLEELRPMAAEGRLVYIIGNHDFDVPSDLVEYRMPGVKVIGPGDTEDEYFWVAGCRLYAKHGHQYSLFNNVSRPSERFMGYPIGYYITRLRSGLGDQGGGFNFGQIHDYLHEIGEVVGKKESVFESVIDAVAGKAAEVRLADEKVVSLEEIKSFARRLGMKYSVLKTTLAAMGEGTLVSGANQACAGESARLVVFGHTHSAMTDDYAKFPPRYRRTYANTGCWCKGQPNFVVADSDEATLKLFAFYSTGEWVPMREENGG